MLVEIAQPAFAVGLDITYATAKNFTGAPVYDRPGCYLHRDAADRLQVAIGLAQAQDLKLLVFDAFRPASAQWALWTHTPDPVFLADPRLGSPHTRGVAVDLTLANGAGAPLDMGTEFDAFTPLSHHGVTSISAAAQKNRLVLLGLMTASGWAMNPHEWWHYQLPDAVRYPLLDEDALPSPMMAIDKIGGL